MPTNIIMNPKLPFSDKQFAIMKQSGQDNSSKVVIDNPNLKAMPSTFPMVAATHLAGAIMEANIKLADNSAPLAGGEIMQAFTPPTSKMAVEIDALPKTEMQAHPEPTITENQQGYLRLRVRAVNNQLTVVSVNAVNGPLAQPSMLIGQHAYEVVLDSQQIAAEGVPDIGESRSYPRPGQHEHHITQRNVVEFNVRIPQAAVPTNAFSRLKINLYRFPDATSKPLFSRALLSVQFDVQAQLIAQLDGFKANKIEPVALDQLSRILPSLKLQ